MSKTNIYTTDCQVPVQVLEDRKPNGKPRPWREKKIRSLIIADSLDRLDDPKRSKRVRDCGRYLTFKKEIESGHKHLVSANFCRERLCPMCQWRRSLKVFYQVSHVMDLAEENKNLIPLFLTVTIRNCKATIPEMTETLDLIFKGWHLLFKIRKIERAILGWFRALEITYNAETDSFHPHIHAILMVDKSYFKNSYIETTEWVQLWRSAMRLDYDPICDIRRIKNGKGKRKGIIEVSKYTVKDTEIATHDNARTDRLIHVLGETLKSRRLYAFGGLLKRLYAKFSGGHDQPDDGDLVHTGDDTIRQDVATVLQTYRWSFGLCQYVEIATVDPSVTGESLAHSL